MNDGRLNATDVVAYAFNTETYCPADILVILDQMADPKKAGIRPDQIQPMITLWGRHRGLGNYRNEPRDPRWDDSTVVPQPIFANEVTTDDACTSCGEKFLS